MIILLNLIFSYTAKSINKEPERDRLFNTGWKFTRDSLSGAEKPEFDDSKWITVDLPAQLSINLKDKDGKNTGTVKDNIVISGKSGNTVKKQIEVKNPLLWSLESPNMYDVEIMKANGYNAIRCAHNPPSETFLNACDKLGMLVIDEFTDMWESYKNPQDYSRFFRQWWNKDLTDMIMRDRNHPMLSAILSGQQWIISARYLLEVRPLFPYLRKELLRCLKDLNYQRV